jgi:hypothetical protein
MQKLSIEDEIAKLSPRDKEYALYLYAKLRDCEDTTHGRVKAEQIIRTWFHYRDYNKSEYEFDPET